MAGFSFGWNVLRGWGPAAQIGADLLTVASITCAAVLYYSEAPARERAAVFSAWNTLASTEGKRASAGRPEALAQLIKSHESLAGIDLNKAILRGVDLSGSNLSLAKLDDVDFSGVLLRNVSLRDASLQGGHFREGCDFTGAIFERTDLRAAVLVDTTLAQATFSGVEGGTRTSFNGANMRKAVFVNSTLSRAIFDNADLTDARMTEGAVDGATFSLATLENFHMTGTSAVGVGLQRSKGLGAVFGANTNLNQARFDASQLQNPVFDGVTARGAVFFAAIFPSALFINSDLRDADFTSADLRNAAFCNTNLSGAKFERAVLPPDGLSARCPVVLRK